jgi:ankyrin repeat protein
MRTPLLHRPGYLRCLLGVILTCWAATAPAKSASPTPDLQSQLQAALFAEEATRDLPAAAAAYEQLLIDYATQRQLAATALFRLAEVRRKQDQKDAAIKLYQRLLAEFPDTEPQARLSRENLTALGVKDLPAPGQLMAPAIPMDPDEERELNRLKTLLENGPDRVLEDFPGIPATAPGGPSTPAVPVLTNAARRGWKQVATWLLDHGADPNKSDPLEAAASNGRTTICELLLTRGAKIETARGSLAVAIAKNYRETADWLMKNGADVNGIGTFSSEKPLGHLIGPPLLAAVVTENQIWLTRLLEAKADPDIIADNSISALHAAAHLGNVTFIQQLLKAGADPNLADRGYAFNELSRKFKGWTAMHYAVKHPAIVKLLLAAGAKVDSDDETGVRPIDLACQSGQTEVAQLLIDAGADVKTLSPPTRKQVVLPSENGQALPTRVPPLLVAMKLSPPAPDLVAALLKAGADVDQADDVGNTPLNYAIHFRQEKIALQLLAAGANPNIPSTYVPPAPYDGSTAPRTTTSLHLALGTALTQESVERMLQAQKNGAQYGSPRENPPLVRFDPSELVQALLKAGAKADATDYIDRNPLHVWTTTEDCPLALGEILLKAGTPIDGQDKSEGITPLCYAFLTEASKQAQPNHPNRARVIPANPPGEPAAPVPPDITNIIARIDFLLQHGANPNLLTKDGKGTMLSFATPQRRLVITRQRLYPKLAEDAAINLYWTDSGATHRIVVAPPKPHAPPLLAEAITHWSESFKDDKWKPDALQRLSIWRKREAGPLEEIIIKTEATELPALHWGDVLEVTSLSEEHQKQEPKGLPLLRQMFRHLVRKVTVKQGDLSQEITLRGSLAVYDPTRPEAPLMAMTPLLNVIGGAIPEYRAGTVSLQHTGPGGPGQEVRWPTKEERKLLPEDGDIITLTAEKDEKKVLAERARCITVMAPGRLASLRVERIDLPPTLLQLLTEVYAPLDESTINKLAKPYAPDQIPKVLLSEDASRVPCQFASPDWSAIKIRRWDAEGKPISVPVDLAAAMARITMETSATEARQMDVPLEVGDIVELLLLDLPAEPWKGLDEKASLLLAKALSGKISLVDDSGRFREVEMKWVPPHYVFTSVGLVPVPANDQTDGVVNSVIIDGIMSSLAKDQRFSWLERGKESYREVNLVSPFVLPGDIVHTVNKSSGQVISRNTQRRQMPELPANVPRTTKRIVLFPDGSLPPEAVAPTPVPQPEPDRKRTVLPGQ